jgi:hypothetical protein
MFELAWWLCYVGAEPILSLASRNSRARQLVHNGTARHFGRQRGRVHPDV